MNCPTCGEVKHQPIPEDQAHCDKCAGTGLMTGERFLSLVPCDCECHR